MIRFSVVALLLGLSTPSFGAEAIDLAKCSEIKGSVERLQCFDALTKSAGAESPAIASDEKGDWKVLVETSKINDSKNIQATVQSIDTIPGKFGEPQKAELVIACREGRTDLYFIFADHFLTSNEDWGRLTLRIDKNKSFDIHARESTDNHALGLWSGSGIKLIRSLYGAEKLLVRVTPFNESSLTVEFPVTGIKTVAQQIDGPCKWPK